MSRSGHVIDGDGNIIGTVTCSQDDDFALQTLPLVEVAHNHPSVKHPHDWTVEGDEPKPKAKDKAK